jgi:diguanylate cyclase (GGDEF)-like protein
VTAVLAFLAGSALGSAAGWVLGRRRTPRATPAAIPPELAEELLASDTATHIAASLPAESSFDALAFALIERCAAMVDMPCALVMREKPGAPATIASVSTGLDARLVGVDVPLDSPAGRALTDLVPVVGASDVSVVSLVKKDRRRPVSGGVAVPVVQGGAAVGAVVAFGDPHDQGGTAVEQLMAMVRKFGPVLVPAYLMALAVRRAETDELTGLPNRRALNAALARNGSDNAALIVLDIDHFKQINDTLGHPAGDAALKHIARVIKDGLRGRDMAARVGGEEFAVWLPGANLQLGMDVAERLRQQVAAAPWRGDGVERQLTISCGVAAYPDPIKHTDNLFPSADAALYRAKRAGRNRVVATQEQLAANG